MTSPGIFFSSLSTFKGEFCFQRWSAYIARHWECGRNKDWTGLSKSILKMEKQVSQFGPNYSFLPSTFFFFLLKQVLVGWIFFLIFMVVSQSKTTQKADTKRKKNQMQQQRLWGLTRDSGCLNFWIGNIRLYIIYKASGLLFTEYLNSRMCSPEHTQEK